MPSSPQDETTWNLFPAMSLLSLVPTTNKAPAVRRQNCVSAAADQTHETLSELGLGNFAGLWDFLGSPTKQEEAAQTVVKYKVNGCTVAELDANHLGKAVKWRDEVDGADLEDNVLPVPIPASNLRTQKRAERRARARARAKELETTGHGHGHATVSDTATDAESGEELESLRRSPDRRNLIASLIGRPRPKEDSPPTSPSPPNAKVQPHTPRQDFPVSNPFVYHTPTGSSHSQRLSITPRDGLNPQQRKTKLIQKLSNSFPDERKYLSSSGLPEPAFTPMNRSTRGIHVFVDISNISIGFQDCLKEGRGISRNSRVRRVPLDFHNFSLVLERGRPAAKRVLAGSDKTPTITQAMTLGYEANMLERVHKAKELTPGQKKRQARLNGQSHGYHSASGPGETSGSETNTGYLSPGGGPTTPQYHQAKWVEQAVDEILHLKMLESLVDGAREPATMVLATGDAAEAEYSGGFMHQVERALANGWAIEVVSFARNTSSLYTRNSFRQKWGPMFKLVQLDSFAELMIAEDLDS